MKLIHTGDLHIGITVNGYNMTYDQSYILGQIINIAKEEQADAVILAGDLYDRSVPSAEAVKLLDFFSTSVVATLAPLKTQNCIAKGEYKNKPQNKIWQIQIFRLVLTTTPWDTELQNMLTTKSELPTAVLGIL